MVQDRSKIKQTLIIDGPIVENRGNRGRKDKLSKGLNDELLAMSRWLVCHQPRVNPRLRLFCFAYAGGSAWMFRSWVQQLPPSIELWAVELPGRGQRLQEWPLTTLTSILQTLGPELLPYLNNPFAFFGHSLGALIAFELCHWLRQTVQISPVHVWLSAARAPHLPVKAPLMHHLSDTDFMTELQRYNGTPESVLDNAELMGLMLPVLRADFTVLETYRHYPQPRLHFPMTGLWGRQDNIVSQEEVDAWNIHTERFVLKAVSGDHFFIQQSQFPQVLIPTLLRCLPNT